MTEEQTVSIMAAIIASRAPCEDLSSARNDAVTLRRMVREEFARTEALATDKQRAAGSAP
jgi:hypothetical protein